MYGCFMSTSLNSLVILIDIVNVKILLICYLWLENDVFVLLDILSDNSKQ